jgi:hypothetical protein
MKKACSLLVLTLLVLTELSFSVTIWVGGPSDSGNTIPFWGGVTACRWQTIWLQKNITIGGKITKIEWQTTSGGNGGTFNNVDILLCHTKLSAVTATFNDNYGGNTPINVYSGTKVIPPLGSGQNYTIAEPTNFTYNNTDNLLIEVSWQGSSGGPTYFKAGFTGSLLTGRVYSLSNKYAPTGTLDPNYRQCAILTIIVTAIESSSIGNIRALFH